MSGFFKRIFSFNTTNTNVKGTNINTIQNILGVYRNFSDFTNYNISKLLSDTKELSTKLNCFIQPDTINNLILELCIDIDSKNSIDDINRSFNEGYFINKTIKNNKSIEKIIKNQLSTGAIRDDTPDYTYENTIRIMLMDLNWYVLEKFYNILNEEVPKGHKSIKQYKTEDIFAMRAEQYFSYILNSVTNSYCIAFMYFIEKKVDTIDKNGEFYKIIVNMSSKISDFDLILKKLKAIYNEFYSSELGNLGDSILFEYAIRVILDRINTNSIENDDTSNVLESEVYSIESMEYKLDKCINNVSNNANLKIEYYISSTIKKDLNTEDFNVYIDSIGLIKKYVDKYYYNISHNKLLSDKERYLKGNFDKEKDEINERFNLNNIKTGEQFEVYLSNLFKKFGYKVSHCGKTGDQGADLVLKIADFMYVVQAKYYTSKLSNTPVQEVTGALRYYNANQGVVVTNSSFTQGAIKLAKTNNIILIDGKRLKKIIDIMFDDNKKTEDIFRKFDNYEL